MTVWQCGVLVFLCVYNSVTKLRTYSATMLECVSVTVFQCVSVTVLQCVSVTFCQCVTVSVCHFASVSLCHCVSSLWPVWAALAYCQQVPADNRTSPLQEGIGGKQWHDCR